MSVKLDQGSTFSLPGGADRPRHLRHCFYPQLGWRVRQAAPTSASTIDHAVAFLVNALVVG